MLNGCKSTTTPGYTLTGDTLADGKALVQQHCTKCHALVPVNALTKDVWTVHSLPSMAQYFAIKTYGVGYYKEDNDTSGMSLQNWQAIVSYYRKLAPDTLAAAKAPTPLLNDWAGFSLKKATRSTDICFTTLVAANAGNGKIYTGDLVSNNLTQWDSQLKSTSAVKLPSAAVSLNFLPDSAGIQQAIVSCIGRLDPVDFPNGKVLKVNLAGNPQLNTVQSELPRPVQTLSADFDKDGQNEIVVCAQGNLQGGVYKLKLDAAKKVYKQTPITNRPGAVQAITGDFNNDGWADIMVLYGVGDEGLAMYLNNKKGGFEARGLLKFPAVNGSSSFQLADIDHDGDLDLIYTCGYNFRDSRILKPYHGLYIYKNTGNFNFKQEWFYPINGCSKAIAADFDGDGDLDIATIAFFADMKNNPAEEFIYFEQDKAMQFKPHGIPVSQYGRWMSMDVSDINHDGKPDILLANYASGFLFQPNFTPNWDEHTPFIVLENHTKK
ncbi:FG-GAP repeat domain-containing protein [Mucilaginibacter gilvus]|nr:VCBS repeat-containing protein [Mucilaginibacter gilvus]